MDIPRLAELRHIGDSLGLHLGWMVDYAELHGITDADLPVSIPDEAFEEFGAREGEPDDALIGEFLTRFAPAVAVKLGLDAA